MTAVTFDTEKCICSILWRHWWWGMPPAGVHAEHRDSSPQVHGHTLGPRARLWISTKAGPSTLECMDRLSCTASDYCVIAIQLLFLDCWWFAFWLSSRPYLYCIIRDSVSEQLWFRSTTIWPLVMFYKIWFVMERCLEEWPYKIKGKHLENVFCIWNKWPFTNIISPFMVCDTYEYNKASLI